MRGIYHYRSLGHSRIIGHITQELLHLKTGIQHRIVHIDVDDARPVLNLLRRDLKPGLIIPGGYQFRELPRTRHVGSFPDIREIVPPVNRHAFQSADVKHIVRFRNHSWGYSFNRFRNCLDVLWSRSAASSHNIH